MTIGLLLLRLVVGVILIAHGSQKLFGWFGGWGIEGTGNAFAQMGFVPGRRSAILAGIAEAGGGSLLALGAATPFAAAMAAGVMLVAIVSVHLKQGFFSTQGGYESSLDSRCERGCQSLDGPQRIESLWIARVASQSSPGKLRCLAREIAKVLDHARIGFVCRPCVE